MVRSATDANMSSSRERQMQPESPSRAPWSASPTIPLADRLRLLALAAGVVLLVACSGEGRPLANPASVSTLEEAIYYGQLSGSSPSGATLSYMSVTDPARGTVEIDRGTGRFTYLPAPDVFGNDQFSFAVFDGERVSAPAVVTIRIENVNDAPRIAAVPPLTNSPNEEWAYYDLDVTDPDLELPQLTVQVVDSSVAEARFDSALRGRLLLRSKKLATTQVTVTAADALSATTASFNFSVVEVTKALEIPLMSVESAALKLRNRSSQTVDFVLTHNGFKAFEDMDDVVEHVRAMPAQFPGEQFDRKLWRFVRDSVYHDVPLSADVMLHDPWVTLNSLGWGFCGHVASVFVEVARAAGYEARLWGLSGHVVPEILVDGEWHMFDPDLAVYYKDASGRVAGVHQLASDPALITNPVNPIFAGSTYQFPYTTTIGDIYGSKSDNFDGEATFLDPRPSPSSRVVLPPQASLTYPGRWTEAPTGYDGPTPYTIRSFRQAMIELPDAFSGDVRLPWLLWDVQGGGTVIVGGDSYAIGSSQLTERLRTTTQPITTINVQSGGGVRLIFMINTARYGLQPVNHVALEGVDVWAIGATIEGASLALGVRGEMMPVVAEDSFAKPLPTIQGL
jgi:hypothetical protein